MLRPGKEMKSIGTPFLVQERLGGGAPEAVQSRVVDCCGRRVRVPIG